MADMVLQLLQRDKVAANLENLMQKALFFLFEHDIDLGMAMISIEHGTIRRTCRRPFTATKFLRENISFILSASAGLR